MIKRGLPRETREILRLARVVGNKAVAPGKIHEGDNTQTAEALSKAVELVARIMVGQPREIERLCLDARSLGSKI